MTSPELVQEINCDCGHRVKGDIKILVSLQYIFITILSHRSLFLGSIAVQVEGRASLNESRRTGGAWFRCT